MKNINQSLWCIGLTAFCLATGCSAPSGKKGKEVSFTKQVLSREYISEGAAIADVNKDGRPDVLAGSFWYEAPNWERHEITTPYIHPSIDGYGNSFLNFSMDVNLDGWPDQIKIGHPGKASFWYENPRNESGHWKEHLVIASLGNESPALADIDGDGRPDLVCNESARKRVVWLRAPRSAQDTGWTVFTISSDTLLGTHHYTHGLGVGDVNLDGRPDVLIREGWWEGPEDPTQADWVFHPADWGPECAQMYLLDVDKDGDPDVIASSAHEYGVWWYEQIKDAAGNIEWKQHEISRQFSQSHGMALVDVNGDGHPDIITGKRFWAHNGADPGAREPAVIYWFEWSADPATRWIPHQIDDDSGVGLNVSTGDMNKDGLPDIVIGNKKGVFVFEQVKP